MEIINQANKWVFKGRKVPDNAFMLSIATESVTHYATLRKNNNHYQVPTGKKLKIIGVITKNTASSTNGSIRIGYGDNGVSASSVAPTNYVNYGTNLHFSLAGQEEVESLVEYEVPAGKYPCIFGTQASILRAICVLEDE